MFLSKRVCVCIYLHVCVCVCASLHLSVCVYMKASLSLSIIIQENKKDVSSCLTKQPGVGAAHLAANKYLKG